MVTWKKLAMGAAGAAGGGDTSWIANFAASGEIVYPSKVYETSDGEIIASGNFNNKAYIVNMDGSDGSVNWSFASKGRHEFNEITAGDVGRIKPTVALYNDVNDHYLVHGYFRGSVTGSNIDGDSIHFYMYDRNTSTTETQLNRTYGRNYFDAEVTANSAFIDSSGRLYSGGVVDHTIARQYIIRYDDDNTGYGDAYTPDARCYLQNASNSNWALYSSAIYQRSNGDVLSIGNTLRASAGWKDAFLCKLPAGLGSLDYARMYRFGNGNDEVLASCYNETLDIVGIVHIVDVEGAYSGLTILDASDGDILAYRTIRGTYGSGQDPSFKCIAIDDNYNAYIGAYGTNATGFGGSSLCNMIMKFSSVNNTNIALEWLVECKGGTNQAEVLDITLNSNGTPIISMATKQSGQTRNSGYVLKADPDANFASTSGSTYLNITFKDFTSTATANVSYDTSVTPSNVDASGTNISRTTNYPDQLSFSNSAGASEEASWTTSENNTSL